MISIKRWKLLWRALRKTWAQLKSGARTSGRGTPVISVWPNDLKSSWKTCPWIWETSHPDGDSGIVNGVVVIPPLLTLVYVRIPRRPVVVQFAWELYEARLLSSNMRKLA